MKDNIQKVINLSFRPLMGIILFNVKSLDERTTDIKVIGFRPLMGIILFNYPERTDLLVPAEVIRFRPLMGIILFNAWMT